MFDQEASITQWKDHLRARGGVSETDIEELETHLRDAMTDLEARGLAPDEAFLVSVKRLGTADALTGEFGKVNPQSLWKQLLLVPENPEARVQRRRETVLVIALCLVAGLLAKLPELLGYRLVEDAGMLYARNLSFFVLPSVVTYLAWKRSLDANRVIVLALTLLAPFVLFLVFPWRSGGQTEVLSSIHLPVALWLVSCVAYAGNRWRTVEGRMDFVRATGELFIYGVLIGLGGGVLVLFTEFIFSSLGLDVDRITFEYLAVMGAAATPVFALFLVESKRSIVESLAPVLARIFTPLFLGVLLVFLVVMPATGRAPLADRELLIAFDLMLALVLGLVLYTISAHRETDRPGLFDYLSLALIVAALVADVVALAAMLGRLFEAGVTPNRLAALGENVVLLVDLAGIAILSVLYLAGKREYRAVLAWQTAYLPIIAVWAGLVALGFPPIFGFR